MVNDPEFLALESVSLEDLSRTNMHPGLISLRSQKENSTIRNVRIGSEGEEDDADIIITIDRPDVARKEEESEKSLFNTRVFEGSFVHREI